MRLITVTMTVLALLAGCSAAPDPANSSSGSNAASVSSAQATTFVYTNALPVPADSFTLVHISDTQYYTSSYKTGKPSYYRAMVDWITNTRQTLNTIFVSHTGDVVDQGIKSNYYVVATNSMEPLYGLIPHGYAWGNHEYYNSSWVIDKNIRLYNHYFPLTNYTNFSWWGTSYPADAMDNNTQYFSYNGLDFMMLNLNYDPSDSEISWANGILSANQSKRVILGTHKYMDNVALDSIGTKIFNRVVMSNTNIFLVLCGHYGGENRTVGYNIAGQPVHQLLADYQHRTNGGSGFLRTLNFVPGSNVIHVSTYCTMSNYYEIDADSRFDISYDMSL